MESELVNVLVTVVVAYFVFRWITKSGSEGTASGTQSITSILGFKPKTATPEMIENVQSAFPDIPRENIHYDLLRSGSVEVTVNRLLERGYLDAPPAAYRRAFPPSSQDPNNTRLTINPGASHKNPSNKRPTLIERFKLETKIRSDTPSNTTVDELWDGVTPIPYSAKGKGKAVDGVSDAMVSPTPGGAIGAGTWEATPEERQKALNRRKEAMILAARRRLLERDRTASK